jgi:hypothetical protein
MASLVAIKIRSRYLLYINTFHVHHRLAGVSVVLFSRIMCASRWLWSRISMRTLPEDQG